MIFIPFRYENPITDADQVLHALLSRQNLVENTAPWSATKERNGTDPGGISPTVDLFWQVLAQRQHVIRAVR